MTITTMVVIWSADVYGPTLTSLSVLARPLIDQHSHSGGWPQAFGQAGIDMMKLWTLLAYVFGTRFWNEKKNPYFLDVRAGDATFAQIHGKWILKWIVPP
jgi:hypothetical protein